MKNLTFILVFVLFATFLVGCGGGDDPVTPTPEQTVPTATTFVGAVEPTSIEVGGSVTSDGNSALTEVYVEATPSNGGQTLRYDFTPAGVKVYKVVLNAVSNTDYSVKFTAKNSKGSTVGNSIPVKTGMSFPIISNFQVANVNKTGANFNFNLLSFAGSVPVEMGVNIYTTEDGQPGSTPVTGLSVQVSGSTPGTVSFSSSYSGGSPGKLMFAKAYCKLSDGSIYHGSEAFFTHTGYYVGQVIGNSKVFVTWNDGSDGKCFATQMVTDQTVGGLGRPSYGFENYLANADSLNGQSATNTLASVTSTQTGSYVNPNGVFKLAKACNFDGHTDWYVMSKDEAIIFWQNRVQIFKSKEEFNTFFSNNGGTYYTSTEINATSYCALRITYWETNESTFVNLYKFGYTDGSLHPSGMVVRNLGHTE
jgi:hypothetical protein